MSLWLLAWGIGYGRPLKESTWVASDPPLNIWMFTVWAKLEIS
jgi:hypothetical protein